MTFYKVLSDESHINTNSLAGELAEQVAGGVAIGPKFGDPLTIHVIKASGSRPADHRSGGRGVQRPRRPQH